MEVIDRFMNPVIAEDLIKRAAQTEAGVMGSNGKTLLDSLLQETTDLATLKLYRGSSY